MELGLGAAMLMLGGVHLDGLMHVGSLLALFLAGLCGICLRVAWAFGINYVAGLLRYLIQILWRWPIAIGDVGPLFGLSGWAFDRGASCEPPFVR